MPPKKNKGARRRGTTLSLQDFLFGDGMATAENPNQNKTNPSKSSTPANNKTKKPKSTDAEPLMVTSEEARFRDNSTTNDEKPAAMCALGSPCTKIVEESNQLIPINGDIQAPIATNGCSETDDKHVVAASGSSNIEQFTESQEHNPIVARLSELMAQIETEAVTYSDPYQQPTMGNTRPKRQHRGRRSHNKRRRRGGRRVWAVSMQDGFMQGNVPQPRSTLQTQSHLENQPSYFIDENYNIFLRTSETSEPSQRKGTNMSGRRHMQRSHRQQPDIEETVEMENAFDVTTPPPPPSAPWDCQDIASEPASSSESYNILVVPANNCLTESGGFNKVTIQILVTPERIDIPKHINTSLVLYHPETGEIAARIDNDNVSHCSGNRLECEWFNKLGKVQPIRMELWHRPGQVLPQFLVPKSEGNYIAYCRIPGEMYSFQPVPEVPDSNNLDLDSNEQLPFSRDSTAHSRHSFSTQFTLNQLKTRSH
ncbi:Hypothetical predicted protein [Drosophila guanche]|uniref:Uncharacterized protein n=1 Tax=Drosophila guanche TaxID=7266 RepID=A0A3B0JWT8_DROGU|nr:Hypothetical predicted protein [Drosophila guanche]